MEVLAPLLGRTLVIVAHPDDEAVTCGALMQRMREPHVLFCTDGAPLDPFFWKAHGSREAYREIREKEARIANGQIGVSRVEFLRTPRTREGITDQQLFQHLPDAADGVRQVIERVRPEALLTLAYEGGHPDHDSCNFLTTVMAREYSLLAWEMPVYNLFHKGQRAFQTFMPAPEAAVTLHPTPEEIARKRCMLESYVSQGHFLLTFDAVDECFRPVATYDYTRPPHEGVLNYESWQWSMTGRQVSAAFAAYLQSQTRSSAEGK
jgi:N-acetylglucosamine malate deacetylase 2